MKDDSSDMSEALQVFDPAKNGLMKYRLTKTALVMPDGMEFATVEKMLRGMKTASDSLRFWLGDLLIYAERNFGEMYSQLLDESDFAYQSLKDMMWVASKIAPVVRRNDTTWSHHREVAKFDITKQREWLARAVEENMTVTQLKDAINKVESVKEKKGNRKVDSYRAALKTILSYAKDSPYLDQALFDDHFLDGTKIEPDKLAVTKMAIIADDVLKAYG